MKSEPTSDDEKRVELDDSNNDVGIDSVNYYLFIKPPELEKHYTIEVKKQYIQ